MITPLGAACMEADGRASELRIERDFKRLKRCPESNLFDAAAIVKFYRGEVAPILMREFPWELNTWELIE